MGTRSTTRLKSFKSSDAPRYEALSYTWEDQKPSQPLKCNGSELLVTPNVEAALKHLRPRFFRRQLWVDAICIDQNNLPERGQQIGMMGHVYTSASRVVIWLGEGSKSTDRAMWILRWVFPVFKLGLHFFPLRYFALHKFMKMKLEFQHLLQDRGSMPGQLATGEADMRSNIQGLSQIVHHNWFRRIWTIQEIALPRKVSYIADPPRSAGRH